MKRLSVVLALLIGCGSFAASHPTATGVTVVRHTKAVPSANEVLAVERIFAAEAAKDREVFDPEQQLTVDWHADGEVLDIKRIVVGTDVANAAHCQNPRTVSPTQTECDYFVLSVTLDEHHVTASSWALLCHELAHVMLWRSTGDPDVNHEMPPGPWTAATNELVQRCTSGASKATSP